MVYCMRLSRYYLNLATNLDTEEQLADMRKELDDIRTILEKS